MFACCVLPSQVMRAASGSVTGRATLNRTYHARVFQSERHQIVQPHCCSTWPGRDEGGRPPKPDTLQHVGIGIGAGSAYMIPEELTWHPTRAPSPRARLFLRFGLAAGVVTPSPAAALPSAGGEQADKGHNCHQACNSS